MSDAKLRDLERRWKETGAVDDEAAYLIERMRVGDLSRERLELAAYCGHEGAGRAVTSASAPMLPKPPLVVPEIRWRWMSPWLEPLIRWGTEACVRALLVFVEDAVLQNAEELRHGRVLHAVEDWICCPCDDHARRSASLAPKPTGNLAACVNMLSRAPVALVEKSHPARWMEQVAGTAQNAGADPDRVVAALSDELVSWALGHADAVRRRIEHRQAQALMTDQRLRDLERNAAHDDVHAQARVLLERVRVGDLTEERLRLAAHLGDEVAWLVVGARPEEDWWFGLARWPAGCVRLALAAAEQVLVRCTEDRAHRAAAVARRWLVDSSEANATVAADASWECHGLDWIREVLLAIRSPSVAHEAARRAVHFVAQEGGGSEAEVLDDAKRVSAAWSLRPAGSST